MKASSLIAKQNRGAGSLMGFAYIEGAILK